MKPGWLRRQFDNASKLVAELPAWMRVDQQPTITLYPGKPMTSRDFCYWLQGFFELQRAGTSPKDNIDHGLINAKVEVIRQHLALVFKHEIDPSMGGLEHQEVLDAIHDAKKKPFDPLTTQVRC